MGDRVHPSNSPPRSTTSSSISDASQPPPLHPPKPTPPETQPPVPQPPGTYIFQIPKDQIYKYPSSENAQRYNSGKKARRSCCCRCCCFTLCFLLLFIIASAIAVGVLYVAYRPEAPEYTVNEVAITGVNLTSSGPVSPEFDVSVRANNKNDKIVLYYEKGSMVNLFYGDIELANGVMPVFYQTTNNVTVIRVALKTSNVLLGNGVKTAMRSEQSKGKVPFVLKMRAPVKIKIGSVKTWGITVKVDCDLAVDALTEKSRIVTQDCDYGVRLW